VDFTLGVTRLSLLIDPPAHANSDMMRAHRQEHFADLFASCYVGESSMHTLQIIAPSAPGTLTHPATADRVSLVNAFLNNNSAQLVTLFQTCLSLLQRPQLSKVFSIPDIGPSFDDIRPYIIKSEQELHGIFAAAWDYLTQALDARAAPWIKPATTEVDIERVVNDLTEKSIRNLSIRQRWASGATS
jgi:hypothetical protein